MGIKWLSSQHKKGGLGMGGGGGVGGGNYSEDHIHTVWKSSEHVEKVCKVSKRLVIIWRRSCTRITATLYILFKQTMTKFTTWKKVKGINPRCIPKWHAIFRPYRKCLQSFKMIDFNLWEELRRQDINTLITETKKKKKKKWLNSHVKKSKLHVDDP